MDRYKVKLTPRALRDVDDIYCYIADHFKEVGTAENMADALEEGIYSLETFAESNNHCGCRSRCQKN